MLSVTIHFLRIRIYWLLEAVFKFDLTRGTRNQHVFDLIFLARLHNGKEY